MPNYLSFGVTPVKMLNLKCIVFYAAMSIVKCNENGGVDLLSAMNTSELGKFEAINGEIYCLQNQSFTISKPASDYFIKPMSSFMVLAVFRMQFTWSTLLELFSPNQGTVLKITIYANRDNTTHILLTYIGATSSTERHKLKVDSISSFSKWTSVTVAVLSDFVSVYIDCKYVTEGRLSASVNLSFDENTMLSIGAEGKGYISTLKIYDMSLHTVRDVLERCYDAFKAFSNGELENATCSHGHVTELLRTTTSAHHTYRSTATTKSLLSCPKNQDFTDTEWPSAYAGELKQFNCTDKYNGTVTRKCNAFGVYENPVYNCTKIELQRLLDTVENDGITSESVAATIESLKTEITVDANKNLHVGDIEVATEIMKMIVIADINSTAVANVTDSFLDVVDNLISNKTTNSWDALKDQGGAARVLYVLDDFIAKVANSNLTEVKNMTFVKNNLYIKIDTANDCKTVSFPGDENRGNGPDWAKQSKDNIEVECRDGGSLQYSGSLFRNLSAIMTGRTEDKRTTKQINGPVLSFKKLATNQMKDLKTESVKIVFQIFNSSLDYPICSYWKKDEHGSNGQWLGDGCWLEDFNRSSGLVTCACSHLTNFAVLMSPSITVSKIHHQALSAITVVGCTLSMTGLVATAIAYLYFWRLVKSDRATLLIHLCVTLFVAYLVFLIGIQRTEHTVTCTSISVVLHYVYLVAFFIMLAEGGVIALMVLRPLGKKDVVSFFLGASYGIPLIIVGISIGVTQFRGYGNERFCWLTVETGLFWAFAGPVLAIVATNMVITVLVLKQLFGVSAMAKRKDVEKIKTGVRSVCILLPVLGLTWVFGIFAVNRDTIVFQYLFAIFNSLQGFLIFIVQCVFDRKVRDAFRQARIRIPLFTTTTDVRTVETEMKSTQKSSSHKGSASTSSE